MENQQLENLFQGSKDHPSISEPFYGFNPFTITLNELHSDNAKFLPPTDSRFRPDQRFLEDGEIHRATNAKISLEKVIFII